MLLFINACVRKESRTLSLAKALLKKMNEEYLEVKLEDEDFLKTSEEFLEKRDKLIANKDFNDPLFKNARLFASASKIVIAAPYWDLSFPASLKQYIEQINVLGITFAYSSDGKPVGLCKAKKLYYVSTAGGPIAPTEYGYGYIKALANNFYGIKDTSLIMAKGLDVYGNDPDKIIKDAIEKIEL